MSKQTTFIVNELCCSTEEQLIRKKLQSLEGTEIRGINIIEKTVHLNHTCSTETVISALHNAGMNAHPLDEHVQHSHNRKHQIELILTIVSGVFLATGLLFTYLHFPDSISVSLFLLVILGSGWNVLIKGIRAVARLSLDMNFLMTIATMGAGIIGKWEEGAVVMFLFALAEMLEHYSLKRSRTAIRSLMAQAPKTAHRVQSDATMTVDIAAVNVGEQILIRPGEHIPLDGIVVSGTSTVNQAPITGESKPVSKSLGDVVYAGSYNDRGSLEIEVTKPYYDTMIARIVRLVEEAQSSRAPINSLVDRFANYYTPIVFVLACIVASIPPVVFHQPFSVWFYRALVLLVIACPCALVLSTPVTIMSGLANAARRGILIKGGKFLEILGSIQAIAFDKTGTLTQGKPRVTDVIPLNSILKEEILTIAALVEEHSEHHFAAALKHKAVEENLLPEKTLLHNFESLTGKGVRANIQGTTYVVGSHQLIEEMNICSPQVEHTLEQLEREGKSTIIVASEQEPIGIIAIADSVRKQAASVIEQLHREGVKRTILLTGDNKATAQAIGRQTAIDEVKHEILPDEKVSHVAGLKERYEVVAMVGDGVNDAPALSSATIGIAMGKTGSDVSLEAADVVLISDELETIPYAMRLSKQTIKIIKQNITLALAIKIIVLVFGIFGIASLWMAIIADDGATLAVILNGLRILKYKDT